MSANRVVGDALWRALCPSVDTNFLRKAIESPFPLLATSLSSPRQATRVKHQRCARDQSRCLSTGNAFSPQPLPQQASVSSSQGPARYEKTSTAYPLHNRSWANSGSRVQMQHENAPVTADDLIKSEASFPQRTFQASTEVIYEALRGLRERRDGAIKIRRFVEHLVKERGEQPNEALYEALVVANWHTTTGSAGELRAIMKEMKKLGIKFSESFYHSALRLLAIHPDYITRTIILDKMNEEGILLNDDGKCSVALGYLRDGQYEMALDYLDQICHEGVDVPGWMFDIFFFVLTRHGFLDEALHLLQYLVDRAEGFLNAVPLNSWYYFLDECSKAFYYEGTKFVWENLVRPGILHPSDGVMINVLNTASRYNDAELATKVIEQLSARKIKLTANHYEALLDCYANIGDLQNAFQVLSIMADAGIMPDQSSTRSLYLFLKSHPERADEVVKILNELSKDHRIPVAAMNVVLEALLKAGDMVKAMHVYRDLRYLCKGGPNQQTFQMLLEQCKSSEVAGFLTSEMHQFSVRSSPEILDHVIRCFAFDGLLDAVLSYLSEWNRSPMRRGWISTPTLTAVLERCYRARDVRVWRVVDEAQRRNVRIDPQIMEVLEAEIPRADAYRELPAHGWATSDEAYQSKEVSSDSKDYASR